MCGSEVKGFWWVRRVEIVAPLLVALGEALKDVVIGGSDGSLVLSGGEDATERRFKFGADSEDVVASENVGTVGKNISLPLLSCDVGPAVVVSAVANGVYGVVGGAAGICGEVIFGEEMIVGGDDDDDGKD